MSAVPSQRIAELREQLRVHDRHYYVEAEPVISDREYDMLFAELQSLERAYPELTTPDSPTQRVGGEPISGFEHVEHAVPMLSIDNTYNEKELRDFDKRVAKTLGDEPYKYLVDPKIDGVAVSLTYERGTLTRAATRGNGKTGDDVTNNVRTIRSVPLKLYGGDIPVVLDVRGEIYWPTKEFAAYNKKRVAAGDEPFANPRNATAGALKQLDPAKVAGRGLRFTAHGVGRCEPLPANTASELYKLFASWGIPVSTDVEVYESIEELIDDLRRWQAKRLEYPYLIDGLVLKVDAFAQRDALGATSRFPRWCIAYKFDPERAESVLRQVDFQVGKLGTITPRAVMDPVLLSGTTVRHASLHNFDQVERLDVRMGDTVVVEKAGEIIPQVVGVVLEKRPTDAASIKPPEQCPVCDGEIEKDEGGVYIRCINPACPAQLKERLIHFAGRNQMDIEGAGEVVVNALVNQALVKDCADLYGLKKEHLIGLELGLKPLGIKTADKLIVELSRAGQAPPSSFLTRNPRLNIDSRTAHMLEASFDTVTALSSATATDLQETAGLDAQSALRVAQFFHPENKEALIKRLCELLDKKALNVKGLGNARIEKLVEEGWVQKVSDLFDFAGRPKALAGLTFSNRLGAKESENLIAGIETSKKRPLSRLLASLNIRHVGASTAELLADHFGFMDKLHDASADELMEIDGVGPEMARSIHHFFSSKEGRLAIDRLTQAGVNMTEPRRQVAADGPLAGKTVVVTGSIEGFTRRQIQELVKQRGGTPTGSVSRQTDLVVFGDSAGSKLDKARALGIDTMDATTFRALIEGADGSVSGR